MDRLANLAPCRLRLAIAAGFICLVFAFAALAFPPRAEAQFATKPFVMMSKISGKCARITDGAAAHGAAAVQWICDDSTGSKWTLVPQAGGTSPHVRVAAAHSGKCLSVSGGSMVNGAAVVQSTCTGIDSQLWTVQSFGQYYRLVAKHSGKCLNVKGGLADSGIILIQWTCAGGDNEIWSFSEGFLAPSQRTRIVSNASNKCADVSWASAAENAAVLQWTCAAAGSTNQQWFLQRASDGYQLKAQHSNKCFAPSGGSQADGAAMVQVTCGSALSQVWFIKASGSNYTIVNKSSNKCLDLGGNPPGSSTALVQLPCTGAATQSWRLTSVWDVGSWSSRVGLPIVPVAAAALNNNKVLFWSAYDAVTYDGAIDHGFTQTALFDVATNKAVQVQVSNTQHEMFCPGTAMLADGRVLVNGGINTKRTSIYDPVTNAWSSSGNMNVARGYNSSVLVDNGKVFTIGGSWSGPIGGKKGELWSPPNGAWAALDGIPATPMTAADPAGVYRGDNHAWMFSTGNGMVFHAGPSTQMNWFNTNGSGSFTPAGNRGNDGYSMNGNVVMYDINRILKLGGAPGYDHVNSVTSAYTIDINGGGVVVTPTGSLSYARAFQNSVVLPDGRVFVAGGQSRAVPFFDGHSILAGEMWDPSTGTFSLMAAASVPHAYHSVGLLLPDARVLAGGGGLCGSSCDNNHRDIEYYSPSYLFAPSGNAAVRPVITIAPATAGYNTTITVTASTSVTKFVLIRMGSVTHAIDTDQRRIPLSITAKSGPSYTVTTPANVGIGTPGYYMLFALDASGVPSVAKIIKIGG